MDIRQYADRIPEVRDRIDSWREEHLPDIRERVGAWRDELPEPDVAERAVGAGLLGFGIVAALGLLLSGRRGMWAWFLPAVLLTGGAALLIAGSLQLREQRIGDAEATVRAELGRLDPIARAKVMKDVAEEQLSVFSRKGATE